MEVPEKIFYNPVIWRGYNPAPKKSHPDESETDGQTKPALLNKYLLWPTPIFIMRSVLFNVSRSDNITFHESAIFIFIRHD
jgi:hypothetical protein